MATFEPISGSICAAKGFRAAGVHCGIRRNKSKKDLSLIVSDVPAKAACVYTQNLVKGAPLLVTKEHVADGIAQAIVCNSGNANTCNANGIEIAQQMCDLVEKYTNIPADNVVVASTGVIGQPLNITPIADHMEELANQLRIDGAHDAASGIMTTDTVSKEIAIQFSLGGKLCTIGGIAKGSGMIHPNMATMLVFISTDAAISAPLLHKALCTDVQDSFNMISVDGDTSTNDMVCVLANGCAGNEEICEENEDFAVFCEALHYVTVDLCRKIAKDGEGATHLISCYVDGAKTPCDARTVAKSVVCSSLLKAAIFGADANWGRVLCAIGYSGANIDIKRIDVSFRSAKGSILVCQNGAGVPFSEERAKEILLEAEVDILIALNDGTANACAWGCDLTYDYVKINGDYRS